MPMKPSRPSRSRFCRPRCRQSVGGAAEEQVVEELLIAACELVQLAGNGESDQEIGTGEQQMLLALQQ